MEVIWCSANQVETGKYDSQLQTTTLIFTLSFNFTVNFSRQNRMQFL